MSFHREIRIGQRTIGPDHPPFIIAEMSGNHNHSLERALQIVDAAAESGADALKIQTYTADTMTLDLRDNEFCINEKQSLWNGQYLYKLYQEASTPWEWHAPIFERCKKHNMLFFSTPFDSSAVDFLESLEVPFYKVASFENTDLPLIRKIAATGKPIIISTGMASVAELAETVETVKQSSCKDLVLLKCTSAYPAPPSEANIATLPHLRDLFGAQVGLSDHTLGIGVAVASVALGATVIEKHFTLNRADGGVDSAFSMEPAEFKALVVESKRAWQSLGRISYGVGQSEKKSMIFRRSLYVTEDIGAGETFNEKNVRAIRPGFGLPPKYYSLFLGKKATIPIKKGTPLSWEFLGQ